VRAALALQAAVAQYSAQMEREHGMRLQGRVGINTGPVVVGTVGNNLRMDLQSRGEYGQSGGGHGTDGSPRDYPDHGTDL
jgi:class 3 adenylate cyclase